MLPNQRQKYRAVPPKPKLIVYIGKSQKMFFEADLNPKKVPNGPKSAKKTPIVAQLKTKDGAVHSHNHSCNSSHFQSQLFRVCRCTSHVYIYYYQAQLKP